MFGKISIGLIAIVLSVNVNAQLKKLLAPVNPEISDSMKSKVSTKKSASIINYTTGYRPPFVQLPEYNESPNKLKSEMVPDLPVKFDLRAVKVNDSTTKSYVSKVKNQGSGQNGGNCWAFNSIGSIESGWMVKGYKEADLSEQNMASCHGYGWKYGEGGNEYFATSYLSRLQGPVTEAQVPYNTAKTNCESQYSPNAYTPESRWIYNNPVLTKKAIMDYGAVCTNIHWESIYYKASPYYSFCSTSRQGANHAIQLVGWDDEKVTHVGKGAWIAKNSWDSTWADKGFFYIAYTDKQILKPVSFYPTIWAKSFVDTLLHYDEIGTVSFMGYDNDTAYTLSKFTTNNLKFIRKIGTFILRTGSVVKIDVYDDFVNDTLKNLIASYTSSQATSPGFYTYDVPAHVNGDFYVKIRYVTPGFKYPVPIEIYAESNGEVFANPNIEPSGKQWVSSDNKKWQALGNNVKDWEADLVVHVYAANNKDLVANIEANKYEVCAGSEVTFTANSDGNADNYFWNFGSDAFPKTAVGKGPHKVTISGSAVPGLSYAILKTVGPNDTDIVIKEYKIVNNLNLQIGGSDYTKVNIPVPFTALCDADTYSWYPDTYLASNNTKEVTFKSSIPGLHKLTVTATQGNCSSTWSTNIEVKSPPVNDKYCDALLLKMGDNGPFTNEGATAEFKEPAPADTSCYDYKTWCDEGGVQNSVWFKVVGPDSGRLTIDTRGMDTQIALYASDDCNSIKNEDLIAASDDYYMESPYAAAIDTVTVVPGKEYFLQVDGSAGGVSGTFYITISYLPIDKINRDTVKSVSSSKLMVYPNPNNGRMTVRYTSEVVENVQVTISDIMGRMVYQNRVAKIEGSQEIPVNVSVLNKGVYYITIKGTTDAEVTKCVIK